MSLLAIMPHDLTAHVCIGPRLPTSGGLWSWPTAKGGRELRVRPQGQLAFHTITLAVDMALISLGPAYLPHETVRQHVAKGKLQRVLAGWSPPADGYHLYYPNCRHSPPAFALLVEAVRDRGEPS